MMAPWVVDEMKAADLKDKRLDNRLREVLSQLGAHPTASIPAACGGHAGSAARRIFPVGGLIAIVELIDEPGDIRLDSFHMGLRE